MFNDWSDKQITDLLDDVFKKIASNADQDTKKLSDMNNTLNWILTLTTFFFLFYSQRASITALYMQIGFRILFVLSIAILVIHKLLLIRYEDFKGAYLGSLRTHYIDLKYNVAEIRELTKRVAKFNLIYFNNAFRNGEFLYHSAKDISRRDLQKLDRKIIKCGKGILFTFWFGLIIFILNFLGVSITLFK